MLTRQKSLMKNKSRNINMSEMDGVISTDFTNKRTYTSANF